MSGEQKSNLPTDESSSTGLREPAESKQIEAEPDYDDLSNEDLLELVAELDEEKYPIAARAQKALSQLEASES